MLHTDEVVRAVPAAFGTPYVTTVVVDGEASAPKLVPVMVIDTAVAATPYVGIMPGAATEDVQVIVGAAIDWNVTDVGYEALPVLAVVGNKSVENGTLFTKTTKLTAVVASFGMTQVTCEDDTHVGVEQVSKFVYTIADCWAPVVGSDPA